METRRFDDAATWLRAAEPLLLADEARHDLILGIAATLIAHPSVYSARRLWAIDRDDSVVGAALQTPPHNLVLARPADEGAVAHLARSIHQRGVRLPGVTDFVVHWPRPDGPFAGDVGSFERIISART